MTKRVRAIPDLTDHLGTTMGQARIPRKPAPACLAGVGWGEGRGSIVKWGAQIRDARGVEGHWARGYWCD